MLYQTRVSKKKSLTDPVVIIPFKGQKIKVARKPKEVAPKKEKSLSVSLNKEAKKLHTPTKKMPNTYLGIKDLLTQKEKDEKDNSGLQNADSHAKDPFTIDEMRMTWRKFAYKAREENISTLYTAMTNRDPSLLEGYKIKHTVDNEVQLGFISSHQIEILAYLRKKLNNYAIELIIQEEAMEGPSLYTSKEKYVDMSKRNPNLETLRNTFKLDIDL